MIKTTITGAVISKGYGSNPAIWFSEGKKCARFKVGCKVYDKQAENNTRWINFTIKAFGPMAERIDKMGLKAGSYVNLIGRPDEDVWDDKDSGTTKRQPIIILEEIEYCPTGGKKEPVQDETAKPTAEPPAPEGGGEFTGYEQFSGGDDDLPF
ncbi:MAG: single-stranded DNA-binding protein [Firmicutes bacterium]|nr:single-stranded DNA-binding protein [Bacillota bacterium]